MSQQTNKAGHRERLRQRFLANPQSLSQVQLIELLLTYAIPRRDVAPLAQALFDQFGSIDRILNAPYDDLLPVPGIGEQAAILIRVVARFAGHVLNEPEQIIETFEQPTLFEMKPNLGPLLENMSEPTESQMRTFANDEIANSLTFIPQAAQFENLEAFKVHLWERLPYNSASTRQRRATYILGRFFPQEQLDVPLAYYAATCTSERDLKPVIFYHILKAESLAAKVAEDFIWPALPVGYVEREAMREFILRYLPDIGASSQKNALRSLFTTYDLLSVGTKEGTTLRFQVHTGTLEAFLYLLTAEFSQPGIYTFEVLEESPLRRWLLWDREWMRRQLYNLRDFGIISKVSEIDTIRQFTLQLDQTAALLQYFEHPERDVLAIREESLPLETSK
jgi:DNA repair protein RadC